MHETGSMMHLQESNAEYLKTMCDVRSVICKAKGVVESWIGGVMSSAVIIDFPF